ncbi:ABC transporter permease [Pseudoclavibacter chungangensis]|uniref:ABC transporter permease n=1 Tax=Pseudoclavibacter chungangensis TaxID=587635 RepID=A0A7J5C0P6_9MICO|nr:ABC transporter permease [Pseudoclavibacter chungangensis]KAB1662194.1 ABC transporter permease [Pseudoclavibacter chungangensis]NYJ65385.1 peptide/nickel transport system permease protein [Pseudoclavibacter chungangensis]
MSAADTLLAVPRAKRLRGNVPVGTILAGIVVAAVIAAALVPGLFTHLDPEEAVLGSVFQPPSAAHPFGTDHLGRDVASRVVHGARYSLLIGVGAALLSLLIGTLLGLLSVYLPFGLDRLVQRGVDILLAFPELLLALLIIAVLGRGPVNTLIAVGLAGAAGYARLVRSQVLSARLSGYAEQAKVLGESPLRVVASRVLPNIARPIVVLATIGVGTSILSASGLSFLGLGVAPPTPEWGALLSEGRSYLSTAPWASVFPATAIALSVVSITVLGRSLQARLTKGTGA